MRVVIAGGGTAGHVFPGLALGRVLAEQGHRVAFAGTSVGLEAKLVPANGFEFHVIRARPLVRRVSTAAIRAPLVALAATRDCRPLVRDSDVVVGMGGYVSVPTILAAGLERVPAVLHEQNAVPGVANRALSRTCKAVALSFREAGRYFPRRVRRVVTGNPVRQAILGVLSERDALARRARREFGLEEGRSTVLVFGGSQGALRINEAAIGACERLAGRADLQILLITGPAHLDRFRGRLSSNATGLLVRVVGFVDHMELAYAVSDLVVSRAGATTVAEVSCCGIPSILIPYPYATGQHQQANARALERAGGASVVADELLSAEALASRIEALALDAELLRKMAAGSASFGRPRAASDVAQLVAQTAGQ